jgi:prephenate dehydratase
MNKENSIITLGPEGSYSSIAARDIIPDAIDIHYNQISKDIVNNIPKLFKGPIGNVDVIEKIPSYMA